jgi:hypothetical protein
MANEMTFSGAYLSQDRQNIPNSLICIPSLEFNADKLDPQKRTTL